MSEHIRGKDIGITPGKGTPGSFAEKLQSTPEVSLAPHPLNVSKTAQQQRAKALADSSRSVGAAAASTSLDPSDTRGIKRWWSGSFISAEHEAAGAGFEKMPDDYTPGQTSGRALSGNRRTHRMKYEGAGVTLRMPSATAIRRYSATHGHRTFDVPVSATINGRQVSSWVRVTEHEPRVWSTKALGFDPTDQVGLKLAEAANAVLESRRPRTALSSVRSLMNRRRQRAKQMGVPLKPLSQRRSFISEAGYDKARGVLAMRMGGTVYGYKVSEQTASQILNARSPGERYNAIIKGRARRAKVELDPVTGRVFDPDQTKRRFGVRQQDRAGVKPVNIVDRDAAIS